MGDLDCIGASAFAIAALKEFSPEIHNLFGGTTKELGAIGADAAGFFRRRLAKIFASLEQKKLAGGLILGPISQEKVDRIGRTAFFAGFSTGEEMLKYWAAIIAYQATAPNNAALDMADILTEALKGMTEMEAHFLRDYADGLTFKNDEQAQSVFGLQEVCGAPSKKAEMPEVQHQLILANLCKAGVVATYNAGLGRGAPRYYLTVIGAELLRIGGWTPRIG